MWLFDYAMNYPQFGVVEPGIYPELPDIAEPAGPDFKTGMDALQINAALSDIHPSKWLHSLPVGDYSYIFPDDVLPSTDEPFLEGDHSGGGGGANWSDDNGNGFYDEGDTIYVTGSVKVVSSGGSGGGGGGSVPGDDSTSIPGPTGEVVAELPGQEPLPTTCVETTFSTPNVSLTDVNRAALAASNVIAGLNNETYEYSSIVFLHNGKVGFTEPYTQLSEDEVNLLGGIGNVPTGAVILGIVHNHPDQITQDDRYPSPVDWAGYDRIQDLSSSERLPRGITADASMLFYMLSDQDDKTRVYDKTDKRTERASCPLQ